MPTTVVNLRKDKFDVYIGRGSKWGNPFRIGIDGNRREVIDKYEEWLLGVMSAPDGSHAPSLDEARAELKGKVLGCFCKPRACHGDILIRLVDFEEDKK